MNETIQSQVRAYMKKHKEEENEQKCDLTNVDNENTERDGKLNKMQPNEIKDAFERFYGSVCNSSAFAIDYLEKENYVKCAYQLGKIQAFCDGIRELGLFEDKDEEEEE